MNADFLSPIKDSVVAHLASQQDKSLGNFIDGFLNHTINKLGVDFSFYDKDRSNTIEGIEFEIREQSKGRRRRLLQQSRRFC